MLSMHIGINKPERGCIRQLFHTVVSGQWSVVPCSLLCPVHRQISSYVLKNVNTYPPPPTHTQPFLTDFKEHTHTPPTHGTKFWRIGPKVKKPQGKRQNPPSWHIVNVCKRNWGSMVGTDRLNAPALDNRQEKLEDWGGGCIGPFP